MKSRIVLWATIILSLTVLVSCAPSTLVQVTRPAEIDLAGINRIAIGGIDGNTGSALSDLLTQRLFESGRYEVLDRQHMDTLMREHSFNLSGAVDEKTSAKIGGILGASALIFGQSNGHYRQYTEIGDPYKCKKDQVCRSYKKTGEGRINTTLKVIDLTTGKVLAVKNLSDAGSDTNWKTNEWPPDPDRDVIMRNILNKTANKFMKMIAPYTENVRVKFEKSKIPQVKAGIVTAQSGQWHSACAQFKDAVDANPNDPAAWYNLGLAYMYTYEFDKAIQAFQRSNAINPSAECAAQIANCNRLYVEQKRLNAQMENSSN